MTYSDKLKHPKWQKKRLEILQRDNFTCTFCEETESTLHVHHKKYDGNPWDAKNEDLRTVCKHCHFILHDAKGVYIDSIYKRKSHDKTNVLFYAYGKENIFVYLLVNNESLQLQFLLSYDSLIFLHKNIPF